ncbi:uncharacterized protein N7459_002955 [Penicillium hispanicum]|uniref:uncharacterized protein n=1 Tax=Penicillium hispanicum TaxID=1080232 RepID=UPI002540BE5D|nr:uncharacterized protein N7459_002955 [Penicillium hispanicum]KAJ5587190.1 hypothetical protein N7459_002955 [Penicillium hispanicum]
MESNTPVARRTTTSNTGPSHLIVPKDGNDKHLLGRLESTISSTTGTVNVSSWSEDGQVKWYYGTLTESQATKLEKDADVDYVVENGALIASRAVRTDLPTNHTGWRDDLGVSKSHLSKRLQLYASQPSAEIPLTPADELIVQSTPEGEYWGCRDTYNYAAEAGSNIYIFHIEFGILSGFDWVRQGTSNIDMKLEDYRTFSGVRPPDSHSTCVADKAMGRIFGAAKKSILVPVLLGFDGEAQLSEALKEVLDKITADKNSPISVLYGHSLIVMSMGIEADVNPEKAPWPSMHSYMDQLFDLGVPIVFAAGNIREEEQDRPDQGHQITAYPQFWSTDEFPLINVGNSNFEGRIADDSKRGEKVAVFAPGEGISCVGYDNEYTAPGGTSFAAPLVGGGIAVFMSQKEGPFYEATHDKVGTREFPKAVLQFVKNRASYMHSGGTKMFWNMALGN